MHRYHTIKVMSDELHREMVINIMLPEDYDVKQESYPVLYMHDGQNLFDDSKAAFNMSWKILEAFDQDTSLPKLIVVGVETAVNRSFDLVPFPFQSDSGESLGGNTDNYLDFIVHTLKPYIDTTYRTLPSKENTGLMGSSYGGVCTTYAAYKYYDYFSKFGAVSNAYYTFIKDIKEIAKEIKQERIDRFYMDVGTDETSTYIYNERYVQSNQEIYDILKESLEPSKLKFVIKKGAKHNEIAWAERFPSIISFLFQTK